MNFHVQKSIGVLALLHCLLLITAPVFADDDEKDMALPLEGKTAQLAFSTDEGSWLSLDIAPDGRTLVFDLLGDLYALPTDGGTATALTSGLGYDSQPAISPNGESIAFISDRDGSLNLWLVDIDGSNPRKLSAESQFGLISPAWTPDGQSIVVTRTALKPELTQFHISGGSGVTLGGANEEDEIWGVGIVASPDQRHLYYARGIKYEGPGPRFPATQISRYDRSNGTVEQITQGEGGGVRPQLSPDGTLLVYGTRHESQTGLRIRNLVTGDDRWLAYPVQRDAQENYRPPSRDLLPGYAFTPDGSKVVTSVLSKLYVADATENAQPERLTSGDAWEFKPRWSPDGRWISYVTWSMNDGGHIWRVRANGRGRPQQLTDVAAFYTDLVYSDDGESLYALRGNEYMRHQTFSEFTGLEIPLELIALPADGGTQTVIGPARGARSPHFGPDENRLYLYDEEGLFSLQLDGSDRRDELVVTGPRGNRRGEKAPRAEAIKLSPDGQRALALVNKQVWLVATTRIGGKPAEIDVRKPALPAVALTDIGADYFGWSASGDAVWWAIGNSFYHRPLSSIELRQDTADDNEEVDFVPRDAHESVTTFDVNVVVPRDAPSGSLLLRGANVITMSGSSTAAMDGYAANQDLLVTDNRIAAVGKRGLVEIPDNATIIDVQGKFVLPGFIDTHAHWEFRTQDVLEPHNWTLAASLAYGVTAGLDVQTAYKDYLAYRDFVESGQSIGQRAFMTARGIFGNNDFQSYESTLAYLRRYKEHYHTNNIKSYVVGNRRQRQWVVLASQELGLMPTTEGAGDQKLDLTHAIDGMHGNEHTLPDSPLYNDVIQLYAQTQTAYTPTLLVQYNAASMREYFFTRAEVHDDEKMQRFYPHNRLDELTQRRPGWQRDNEFQFEQAARQAAKIQRAGGLVGIGAHGELQGLGYHWEMWGFAMGGMRPVEVLRAATIDGARIIGVAEDLGSIEPGKLADLVILDANPLDDIRRTTAIDRVMKNGRLYDGDSLDQEWPEIKPLPPFWWWFDDDRRFSTGTPGN